MKLFVENKDGQFLPVERSSVEGVPVTHGDIESVRGGLIELRDEALTQGEMTWAVLLSHAIAYIFDYQRIVHATEE